MAAPSLEFRFRRDLSEQLSGQSVVAKAICCDGRLAVVTTEPESKDVAFERTQQPGQASFPVSRASRSYEITVHLFGPQTHESVSISNCLSVHPIVQTFPDNSILLVSSRCRNYADGPELNASVYSLEGKLLRQFCLGDGISKLLVTQTGEIWVGYFDEGVYGNFGWDQPLGASGLNCFDSDGNLSWSYIPPDGFDVIDDCYAMTLAGNSLWACYYSEFPLAQVDKFKKVTCWRNETCGATALATNGRSVLFFGGYGDKRHDCFVSAIKSDGSMEKSVKYELSLAEGLDRAHIYGYGSDLHAVVDFKWYVLSIDDL